MVCTSRESCGNETIQAGFEGIGITVPQGHAHAGSWRAASGGSSDLRSKPTVGLKWSRMPAEEPQAWRRKTLVRPTAFSESDLKRLPRCCSKGR